MLSEAMVQLYDTSCHDVCVSLSIMSCTYWRTESGAYIEG